MNSEIDVLRQLLQAALLLDQDDRVDVSLATPEVYERWYRALSACKALEIPLE